MSAPCPVCGFDDPKGLLICPQCGANTSVAKAARSADAAAGKKLSVRTLAKILIPLVVALGIWTFYRDAFREYHPVIAKQPEFSVASTAERVNSTLVGASIEGPFLIVSLKDVMEHRIVRFFDPANVQDVPIIAYFTSTGKLVTAMSISESCRSRDFYLEGENIHCASCPSYWNAASLEAYACCQKYYPDPVPSTVLGDEIRLELEKVRGWQPRS